MPAENATAHHIMATAFIGILLFVGCSSRQSGPVWSGDAMAPPVIPRLNCAEVGRWIYLIDSYQQLLKFQPDDLSLTPVGVVSCGSQHPFSLTVDRRGRAWVVFRDRSLYLASVRDGDGVCIPTSLRPNQSGFELFGLAFVSDTDAGAAENLFVAGGAERSIARGPSWLGSLDKTSLVLERIASLPGWPELTGTGSGELWGFFPDTQPPTIEHLNKATGASEETFELTSLAGTSPSAWAFAFWGGRFYVFLETTQNVSTHVFRFDPADGTLTQVLSGIGYTIVGAGVSTCAPVDLI